MCLVSLETHRSIAGGEHGGDPKQGEHRGVDLRRKSEGRRHGEIVQLNPRTLERSARPEEAGIDGDGARSVSAVVGEEGLASATSSSLARFLARRRRGGGGGARGAHRSTWDGLYRR